MLLVRSPYVLGANTVSIEPSDVEFFLTIPIVFCLPSNFILYKSVPNVLDISVSRIFFCC
nr:MAG TPA: hypothetical protein [Bacteriophage sp.]